MPQHPRPANPFDSIVDKQLVPTCRDLLIANRPFSWRQLRARLGSSRQTNFFHELAIALALAYNDL